MNDETKRSKARAKYWTEKGGILYARLQYTDETGQRREKYRRIPTKSSARAKLEEMRREIFIHGSDALHSDRMTFIDLAEEYEKARVFPAIFSNGIKVAGRRSVGGIKTHLTHLKAHFGKKMIRKIKIRDIESYKTLRLDTPVSTEMNERTEFVDPKTQKKNVRVKKVVRYRPRAIGTVNKELQTLRAMLNYAVENDWLILNPFQKRKGIISSAGEVKRDRVLFPDEEVRLLAACHGKRAHLKPLVICALDTAMRRGEMFKMKWRDVDFQRNEIYIPQTNSKTETARTVGISSRLREELIRLRSSMPLDSNALVFGVTSTVKNAWKSALKEAGIEHFVLHDCRHTATTRMVASGSPHPEVMKITGHTQMSTFLRYLNVTSEMTSKVANRLDLYLARMQESTVLPSSDTVN